MPFGATVHGSVLTHGPLDWSVRSIQETVIQRRLATAITWLGPGAGAAAQWRRCASTMLLSVTGGPNIAYVG